MSSGVRNSIGQLNAENLLNFLRGHIFVHEEYFAAHKYNRVLSFCDYSNTPLEGTNGGLKYGYFAVEPHMKISKSASYMIVQDECKHNIRRRTAYENQFKTKLYDMHVGDSKETKHITPKALGEMRQQIQLGHSYCSIRLDRSKWLVRTGGDFIETASLYRLPRFLRFRYVTMEERQGFVCTCPFTSMYGLPCRHIAHVIQYYSKTPFFFSHRDVDIRWWTTYANFAAIMEPSNLDHNEQAIREQLRCIRHSLMLTVGNGADILEFVAPMYVHGNETSKAMQGISLNVARANFFTTDLSHPSNYDHDVVEAALVTLQSTYVGIKKTFMLTCDSDDSGGDVQSDDFDDDGDDGYNGRIFAANEEHGRKSDRFLEMRSIFKELMSHLENVDDEYYNRVKEQMEQRVGEAHVYSIERTRSSNKNNGTLISCMPIDNTNTTRKHKRQQTNH